MASKPNPQDEQRRLAIQMLGGCLLVVVLAAFATWIYLVLYGRAARRNEEKLEAK